MASKKLNATSIGRNSAARAATPSIPLLTDEGIEPIRPIQLQPVESSVYQLLYELNAGFENVIRHFAALEQVEYLWDDNLNATRNLICRVQAEVNFHVLEPISERELSNSTWYDRLCLEWEKQIEDPDDVLIEAERIKQERGLSESKGAKKPAG
ncbi:MAG: hypothetical protein DMG65_20595 [Candidatus Angelobacter sp. Gp1-AA117]|nr:MAG: hypothetical protein DMG65_20595 [Candidatus Angelobacter sp. Gp1-AA117]